MRLIDTHTHLYLNDFKKDVNAVIQRAIEEGVTKFYLPSIDSDTSEMMFQMESIYPDNCFAMLGLHPCSVKENYREELMLVNSWLQKRKFIALGEIGLDFYWDKSFIDQQYESFHQQIDWALLYNLPIVIHTRNAMTETINLVKKYTTSGLNGIFHCFSGSYENAVDIINAGFLLGVGGIVTYRNSGVAEAIKNIDLANIVLETDSPYLTPVPFRGKRNESSYLKYVAQKVAEIKNISIEEVAEITTANAERIFASIKKINKKV